MASTRLIQVTRSECGRVVARVNYSSTWNEYSVDIYADREPVPEATYFTDDKQDAINTAHSCIAYAVQTLQPALTLQPK